jgi:PAS domain S-box-containing protein
LAISAKSTASSKIGPFASFEQCVRSTRETVFGSSIGRTAYLVVLAGLAATYFVAGKFGLRLALVHPSATAVWAPSGIALAACLLFGRWVWPAIFAAAFLVNITTAGSIATSLAIASGNTLEALLGSYFIDCYANGRHVFDRTRDAFKFLALCGVVSTIVSASIGVTSLSLVGFANWTRFPWIWLTWWLGDAGGDLIVAPVLILWAVNPVVNWSRRQKQEALLLVVALLSTGVVVFSGLLPLGLLSSPPYPPGLFCFPILLWAAFRFGPRESATVTFALSLMAIAGTLKGHGPFFVETHNRGLLLLQTFMGLTGMISVAVATAINERRRLDATQSELAAIVDSSSEAIVGMTLDGYITAWNDSAARIFGFSALEAVGKPLTIITPDEKLAEQRQVVAGLALGESVRNFETIGKRKDGTLIDVSLTVSPIKDRDRQIVGASKIVRDISGEKLARQQREELLNAERAARAEAEKALAMLRQLQMVTDIALPQSSAQRLMSALLERLRFALDVDAAAILLLEPDGQHLSSASSLGFRAELGSGRPVRIALGQGVAGRIAVSANGLTFDDLSRVERFNSFLPEQLSSMLGAPLKVGERVIGVIQAGTRQSRKFSVDDLNLMRLVADRAASAIERTRLHEMQRAAAEAAEAASRAKDEFLAMLGHELRNPLNAIVLASRLLECPGARAETIAKAGAIIARQAEHVSHLTDDLLEVSRVTSGRIVLIPQSTNLADLVSDCIDAFRQTGQLDAHQLHIELEPTWVDADVDRLTQIVTNLLSNAIKYTPAGGRIEVSVASEGEEVVLRVRDNGVGIVADLLPHVFDLFIRGNAGLDRAPNGLGVGLTLVKRLVELHGGRVEALSDGLHRGTIVTVRLARITAPTVTVHAAPAENVAGPRRRILIVEDNHDTREALRALLQLSGYEVFEAADGSAGVSAALALRPDVALIDIGLPGFNGYEVAQRILSSDAYKGMVLVALSGYAQKEDRQRAESAGFKHYLLKPVEPDKLFRLLARLPISAVVTPETDPPLPASSAGTPDNRD